MYTYGSGAYDIIAKKINGAIRRYDIRNPLIYSKENVHMSRAHAHLEQMHLECQYRIGPVPNRFTIDVIDRKPFQL